MEGTQVEQHIERRKARRILLEIFAKIKKNDLEQDCYIQNISQGGALVYFSSPLKTNDKIEISFEIGQRSYSIKASIKSIRDFSERRKYILRIGKSLDFSASMNIAFDEMMDLADFEYIKLNLG